MIRVQDLQNAPLSMRFYGGHDGCKEGIVANGENWIIKSPLRSPGRTKEQRKRTVSASASNTTSQKTSRSAKQACN